MVFRPSSKKGEKDKKKRPGGKKLTKEEKELENAENRYNALIEKRNELNKDGQLLREERDSLHNEKKTHLDEMQGIKEKRYELNKVLQTHKRARNEHQRKAKELIALKKKKSGNVHNNLGQDVDSLKAEIKQLEFSQETVPMNLPQEKELLDKLRAKKEELGQLEALHGEQASIIAEVEKVDEAIDALFKKADEEHLKVVEYSDKTQTLQDRYTQLVHEVSHLMAEANKKHAKFLKIRERADYYHERSLEMRSKVLSKKKEKWEERKASRALVSDQNKAARAALNNKDANEKRQEDAMAALLKGGKIEMR